MLYSSDAAELWLIFLSGYDDVEGGGLDTPFLLIMHNHSQQKFPPQRISGIRYNHQNDYYCFYFLELEYVRGKIVMQPVSFVGGRGDISFAHLSSFVTFQRAAVRCEILLRFIKL